jgi:hypothetical protein
MQATLLLDLLFEHRRNRENADAGLSKGPEQRGTVFRF